MIKYIFFDNDGVLVDTEKHFFKATQLILNKYGMELTRERFIELTLIGNEGGWRVARDNGIGEDKIEEMRSERNKLYAGFLENERLIIPGVEETLGLLAGRCKMAIVTSSKRHHFDLIHKNTGILKYFDFILTREDYGKSKPNPEPYLMAVEKSGCSGEECMVVEDSQRGLIAAREAGIRCAVIPGELTSECDFTGAWKILDSIKDIPALLNE